MKKRFEVFISNKDVKWKRSDSILSLSKKKNPDIIVIPQKMYQKHLGFGGAFTDATVENYLLLDEKEKELFVKAYFSKDGLNYNLGRYPIHSTDFSSFSYDYLEEGPHDLKNININKDNNRIELVRRCEFEAKGLDIMMSVWSPFKWMKDNNSLYQGGHLLKEYYRPWANYLVDVLTILKDRGVNITMITSQNEVMAKQTWESCIYTPEEEGLFVNELYESLKEKNQEDIHILLMDHNRDLLPDRVVDTLKYCHAPIYGIAYHWYDHSEFDNLTKTHELYPEFHLLMSECCVELLIDKNPIGNLSHAERYACEIIKDLNNYSEGYIDWNLLLNEIGGPNHVGNYCESPIMMDRKTRKITLLPSYYYIGHFSKFISPGSVRIETQNSSVIPIVSYLTPDNKVVTVILNQSDEELRKTICILNKTFDFEMPPHSIITVVGYGYEFMMKSEPLIHYDSSMDTKVCDCFNFDD